MHYIPKNIQGIEGDDIPFHLSLIGTDIKNLPSDIYFYPLNDHYNTHGLDWKINTESYRTIVFYDLVNTGDREHTKFCNFISNYNHPNKVYLTVNQSPNLQLANVNIIKWDFMWNRTKAYYTEDIPEQLYLHHYTRGKYQQFELDFARPRRKTFLSMTGRNYGYRTALYDFVKNYDGYVSNRGLGITLENTEVVGAFTPASNNFYLDSYFSVYVESNCEQTDLIHITEKTFEPLIKGHFILPVSNPGTIRRLRDIGFAFPKFIDYSFDKEKDIVKRFSMIKSEFNRLLTLDWPTLYIDNKNVLLNNQNCVNSIPYDRRINNIFNV